jgi:hypothetical protein
VIGCLRIAWANVSVAVTLDDLDQRHDGRRVEVVEADHLLGAERRFADLGDRQRGGVGGKDRVPRGGGVELGEHALLDVHTLGHRLDHEVDVAEALIRGRAVDAAEHLLDLSLALLGREPALLDELSDLATGDVAGLIETCLDECVVDVLEHHGDTRGGDRLGYLAAHGAGANDGGSEHEHA